MHSAALYAAFYQSLRWNAALYFLYKILFTTVSFLLFNRLSVNDFSAWATINSFIFLLLLWLDCGLRKSIPRYCPEFERCGTLHTFLFYVLSAQVVILTAACPLFWAITQAFFRSLSLPCNTSFFLCGTAIFLTEGINSCIKLFYHAHFWNKHYTFIQGSGLLGEMIVNLICIGTVNSSKTLLLALLMSKSITSSCVALVGLITLVRRYTTISAKSTTKAVMKRMMKKFIIHSGMMWFNTVIKSLTERNFLVPFLAQTIGLVEANLFKVANDWAMLVHRPVIKTIGTTDTALLSRMKTGQQQTSVMLHTYRHLLKKIAIMSIPFLLVAACIAHFVTNSTILLLFFIIVFGHLTETILSPHERLLEVHHNYKLLLFSYSPYMFMIGIAACYPIFPLLGLINSFLVIHGIRLLCSIFMVYYVYKLSQQPSNTIIPARQEYVLTVVAHTQQTNPRRERDNLLIQ